MIRPIFQATQEGQAKDTEGTNSGEDGVPASNTRLRVVPGIHAPEDSPFHRLFPRKGRPWNIGILSDFTRIPYANGAVFQTRALYQSLHKGGHRATLIGPRDPESRPGDVPPGTIELPSLPLHTYRGVHLPVPLAPEVFDPERYDFDLCFAQTNSLLLELGVWMRKQRGIPLLCVNTTHLTAAYDVLLPESLSRNRAVHAALHATLRQPVEQTFVRLYNESDGLIVLSETLESYWRERGVKVPIFVIERTVPPEIFGRPRGADPYAPLLRARGLPEDGHRLLNAGRMTREKEQHRLLHIFARYVAPYATDAVLFLVGDGPDTPRYRELARQLGVERQVIFTGEVSQKQIPDFHRWSTLFLHTSRSETFGNVLSEALWCGAPVVAFADGMGASSQLRDGLNGLLIDPGDQGDPSEGDAAFGRAVLALLASPERRLRLGQRAARMAAQRYAPEVIQGKLVDAFLAASDHAASAGLWPLARGPRALSLLHTARHFQRWTAYMSGLYLCGHLRPRAAARTHSDAHPGLC
jgi:glycosyltransferase involved in cell wall biosynthesis